MRPKIRSASRLPAAPDIEIPQTGISAQKQFRAWARLFRVHQYTKNILLFVPLVTAQHSDVHALFYAVLSFIAFCLCASGVYIVNDIVDIQSDRLHPTKAARPLASGSIRIDHACIAATLLFCTSTLVAASVSPSFLAAVIAYAALTLGYTLVLKRMLFVDVVTLATLYTIRVLAGAIAIDVSVSQWLLAFSLFIFTSLALVKRHAELTLRIDHQLPEASDRDYRKSDLGVLIALAAAAGYNAVTVFALYAYSDTVRTLYSNPQALWMFCPILMFWIGRIVLLTHRGRIDDDPIIFALKDRTSYLTLVLALAVLIIAKW